MGLEKLKYYKRLLEDRSSIIFHGGYAQWKIEV